MASGLFALVQAKILYPSTFWPISWATLLLPQPKFITGTCRQKAKNGFASLESLKKLDLLLHNSK
jgi:hypothetical protein